ncbi:MAG: hypothetical protein D6730_15080 [Bacteroidetes bacterium]|nr:MAG: hypothetical protein D6730_15080 [Bacteroidota bacterium]
MRIFSKYVYPLLLLTLPAGLWAQQISAEQIFEVQGYSIFDPQFLPKVLPGASNRFAYLEYWAGGTAGRERTDFYLQSYGVRNYVEHWFKPVSDQQQGPPMKLLEVHHLEKGYFVLGEQGQKKGGTKRTVARFIPFDGADGKAKNIRLSPPELESQRKFQNYFYTSPGKQCMLWLGTSGKRVFAGVWNTEGDSLWSGELSLPLHEEKYAISEIQVDDSANVYFLMEYSKRNFTPKDTLTPPYLLKYLPKSKRFEQERLNLGGKYPLRAHMRLRTDGQLIWAAILADGTTNGILNGTKLGKPRDARHWTHIGMRRYRKKDHFELAVNYLGRIPDSWMKTYGENGCNFSKTDLMIHENYATLLLEEQYKHKDKYYFYDIGCITFHSQRGELLWEKVVRKRQRDKESPVFLSFVAGVARGKLRLVYLSERGARGKVLCTSLDLKTGARKDRVLALNEGANYLFIPSRSGMVTNVDMVLVGMGHPALNDYKLITVSF